MKNLILVAAIFVFISCEEGVDYSDVIESLNYDQEVIDSSQDEADEDIIETETKDTSETLKFRSGERLKAVVLQTPGGAFQFTHWYDNELEIMCNVRKTYVGDYRCFPLKSIASTAFYSDESCEYPVFSDSGSECSKSDYILEMDTCGSVKNVFEIGKPYEGALWYTDRSGECLETNIQLTNLVSAGMRISTETFVQFKELIQ